MWWRVGSLQKVNEEYVSVEVLFEDFSTCVVGREVLEIDFGLGL